MRCTVPHAVLLASPLAVLLTTPLAALLAASGSNYFRVKLPFTLESSGQIIFGYPPAHPHQIAAAFEVL